MNIKSYKSKENNFIKPKFNEKIFNEIGTSDNPIEGARGLSMPIESVQIPIMKDNEDLIEVKDRSNRRNHHIEDFDDLSALLLELADGLDNVGMNSYADFVDFLIIKTAASGTKNYEKLFRASLINISNSDIPNASKIISDAVIEYSNLKVETGSDEIAYQNAINKLYLPNIKISKKAQILEMNPIYVADQLYKIIKIMLAKISPEKRGPSFKNVANKLSEFNTLEIANKRAPGGAAIGASLGLVKNILNSKDAYFINLVIKELIRKL